MKGKVAKLGLLIALSLLLLPRVDSCNSDISSSDNAPVITTASYLSRKLPYKNRGSIDIKSTDDEDDDDHGPEDNLRDYCDEDIDTYCHGQTGEFAFACLEAYKSQLSEKCSNYLGSTAFGGCNNEATTLCPGKTSVSDILECLKDNEEKLSTACLANLLSNKSKQSRWEEVRQHYVRMTNTTSRVSMIFLAVPTVLALLATYMAIKVNEIGKKVLDETSSEDVMTPGTSEVSDIESSALSTISRSSSLSLDDSLSNAPLVISNEESNTLEIAFMNICYTPQAQISLSTAIYSKFSRHSKPKKMQPILRNICGEFSHSSVTAIMGPSGSGKTTLLKLLAGQILSGEFSGYRYLNGQSTSPERYLKVMYSQGYVAQQDIFLESLTVWQTLKYAALLRIRDDISVEEKLRKAKAVMTEMGLETVANVVLSETNGENTKGISGGQRRRLSIAQAFLGDPQALLLDEPTSGLDASSSLKLLKILHKMCRKRRTTIALTIHQPRSEVFDLFDKLLLLGAGGYLIYSGPSAAAVALISQSSFATSPRSYDNPGDFIMDVLGTSDTTDQPPSPISCDSTSRSDSAVASSFTQMPQSVLHMSQKALEAVVEKTVEARNLFRSRNNDHSEVSMAGEYEMTSFIHSDAKMIDSEDENNDIIDSHEMNHEVDDNVLNSWKTISHNGSGEFADDGSILTTPCMIDEATECILSADSMASFSSIDIFTHDSDSSIVDIRPSNESNQMQVPEDENHNELNGHKNQSRFRKAVSIIDKNLELNQLFRQSQECAHLVDRYPLIAPKTGRRKKRKTNDSRASQCLSALWMNVCSFVTSSRSTEESIDPSIRQILDKSSKSPSSFFSQVWIQYSRRVEAQWPSSRELIAFILQMTLIAGVTCYTFNYEVSTQLEIPYQVLMVLVVVTTYAMILQYLSLVPEYMNERKVILAENNSQYLGFSAYIIGSLLTEVPRAILQSVFFIVLIYALRPVNPDPTNQFFFVACLMVGVCAWQAQIAVCSVITDQISHVYTLTFMVLGSGTLFGGLVLRLSKIPVLFKVFYYLSVTAVTQRALVVNDMQCCYLTTTCNSLASEIKKDEEESQQPPGPQSRHLRAWSHRFGLSYIRSQLISSYIFNIPESYMQEYDKSFNIFDEISLSWSFMSTAMSDGVSKLTHRDDSNISDTMKEYHIDGDRNNQFKSSDVNITRTTPRELSRLSSQSSLSYVDSLNQGNNYCPPGIQFTGDGSDEGNLGRLYLTFMGLNHDFPFFSLLLLFFINIMFRILAGVILVIRKRWRYQLKYVVANTKVESNQRKNAYSNDIKRHQREKGNESATKKKPKNGEKNLNIRRKQDNSILE